MSTDYLTPEQAPPREEIDRMPGLVLLEFGTPSCGYCRALAPHVAAQATKHPEVRHLKVEDGPGQPLGRSFRVKLWPNLVFLRNGQVVRQLARPTAEELRGVFEELTATAAEPAESPR